jgi:hypothetical protein
MIYIQTWICFPSNGCHFFNGWLPLWLWTNFLKKIPWVDSIYLDIFVGKFENFGLGWPNFFPPRINYFLCNLPTMGVRYNMQVGNTQKQHKEHVQNHMGKKNDQPHLTLGRSNSWFQRFLFITKKPFIIVPKNS